MEKLARFQQDIINAFMEHDLDILCLCELGEVGIGLADKLGKSKGLDFRFTGKYQFGRDRHLRERTLRDDRQDRKDNRSQR